MFDRKEAVDLITLQQRLKNKQQLEGVGGLAYLSSLPDAVPSAANLTYYLEIVREKFILRKMIGTCTDVVARVYEHEGEVDALLDEVERDILRISEARVEASENTIKELVNRAITTIEDFHQRQGKLIRDQRPVECGSRPAVAAIHECVEQQTFRGPVTARVL